MVNGYVRVATKSSAEKSIMTEYSKTNENKKLNSS